MFSFHSDLNNKETYLNRIRLHCKAGNFVQGKLREGGKSCAIGRILESKDHANYPTELGLPLWLSFIEDHIFETLDHDEAIAWPEQFLSAIPVGVSEASFSQLRDRFMIFWLERIKSQMKNMRDSCELIEAMDGVISLLNVAITGQEPNATDWADAANLLEQSTPKETRIIYDVREGARAKARSAAMEATSWALKRSLSHSAARVAAETPTLGLSGNGGGGGRQTTAVRLASTLNHLRGLQRFPDGTKSKQIGHGGFALDASEARKNERNRAIQIRDALVKRDWFLAELSVLPVG